MSKIIKTIRKVSNFHYRVNMNAAQFIKDSQCISDMSQDYSEAAKKLPNNLIVQYFVKVQKVLKIFKGKDTETSFTVLGNKFDLVYNTTKNKFIISFGGNPISRFIKGVKTSIKSFKEISAVTLCQDLAEAELNGLSLKREQTLQQDLKDLNPKNLAKLKISFPKTLFTKLQKNRQGESQQDVLSSVGMKNILTKQEYERLSKKESFDKDAYTSAGDFFIRKNSEVLELKPDDNVLASLARTEGGDEFVESLFNTRKQHYVVWNNNLYKVIPGVDEEFDLSLIRKK